MMHAILVSTLLIATAFTRIDAAAESKELTVASIPANLPPAMKDLLAATFSEKIEERLHAAEQLRAMGPAAAPAIPFLVRLLDDESQVDDLGRYVGVEAKYALAAIGEASVEPCFAAAKSSSGTKRLWAIGCLAKIGSDSAMERLGKLLEDPDADARRAVLICQHQPDARLFDRIVRSLGDENLDVRVLAAGCLARAKDARAVEPLILALGDGESRVREAAAASLGKMRTRRAVPALLEMLTDQNEQGDVRGNAAFALGQIGDQRAFKPLLAALEEDGPDFLRWNAARGLGLLGDRKAADALSRLLQDKTASRMVRGQCGGALASMDRDKAVRLMREIVRDVNDERAFRFVAAVYLANTSGGAVDDIAVVDVLAPLPVFSHESIGAVLCHAADARVALRAIAKNGKTDAIRAAAEKALEDQPPGVEADEFDILP